MVVDAAFADAIMQLASLALVFGASVAFVCAAVVAKLHALDPSWTALAGALLLYSVGNILVITAMRQTGLGLAMSLSTVIQLVLINVLAFGFFGERLSGPQYVGIGLAIAAVTLIVLFPPSTAGH